MIETEKVTKIVREAGMLMMKHDMYVMQKGNNSNYVTPRDIAVEKSRSEKLQELLPGSLVYR